MERILNLTQHKATPDQIASGVIDLEPEIRARVIELLTFNELPTHEDISARVEALALIVADVFPIAFGRIMIGGAPYLLSVLSERLKNDTYVPLYAFSRRESIDVTQDDGSVRKTTLFKHIGFIEA